MVLRKALPPALALKLLPQVSATGRFYSQEYAGGSRPHQPLVWDSGEPWRLWLDVRQDERDQWAVTGSLRRGGERMELEEPKLLLASGLLVARGTVARFDHAGAFAWVVMSYRFNGRVPQLSERARATVILEKQRAGWRIRHVHSSMVARW